MEPQASSLLDYCSYFACKPESGQENLEYIIRLTDNAIKDVDILAEGRIQAGK